MAFFSQLTQSKLNKAAFIPLLTKLEAGVQYHQGTVLCWGYSFHKGANKSFLFFPLREKHEIQIHDQTSAWWLVG